MSGAFCVLGTEREEKSEAPQGGAAGAGAARSAGHLAAEPQGPAGHNPRFADASGEGVDGPDGSIDFLFGGGVADGKAHGALRIGTQRFVR